MNNCKWFSVYYSHMSFSFLLLGVCFEFWSEFFRDYFNMCYEHAWFFSDFFIMFKFEFWPASHTVTCRSLSLLDRSKGPGCLPFPKRSRHSRNHRGSRAFGARLPFWTSAHSWPILEKSHAAGVLTDGRTCHVQRRIQQPLHFIYSS